MKFSNILLSVALTFSVAYTKSIEYDIIKKNASNGTSEHIEYKNFSYNFNCLEDDNGVCDYMKQTINMAIDVIGSTFGKFHFFFFFFFYNYIKMYKLFIL